MNANKLEIYGKAGVAGRYKFIRSDASGNVRHETDWSENIIVGSGLDYMLYGTNTWQSLATNCQVGSGSNTPALGNSALQTLVATSSTVEFGDATFQTSTLPYYVKYVYRYRFSQGAAAGNLTEVGIRMQNSPQALISRALIKDAGGNPTTLTVLSDEFLDVVWEFYLVLPVLSGTVNLFIDGVSTAFNYDFRPLKMNAASNYGCFPHTTSVTVSGYIPVFLPVATSGQYYTVGRTGASSLAALTATVCNGSDTSPVGYFTTVTLGSYSTGSYTRTYSFKLPLNNGNHASGLNSFMFSFNAAHFQMLLNNPIMKVATKTLEFTFVISLANTSVPTN